MLAKIHAHHLANNVSGQDIFLFLSFLSSCSGMPMRSMQDLFSQKTKIKQVKGLKEEQLPVVKAIADNLNDHLVQAIALASPNSICTATAGIEAIVAQSIGEDKISAASSRWMLSSLEDQNATRTLPSERRTGGPCFGK